MKTYQEFLTEGLTTKDGKDGKKGSSRAYEKA